MRFLEFPTKYFGTGKVNRLSKSKNTLLVIMWAVAYSLLVSDSIAQPRERDTNRSPDQVLRSNARVNPSTLAMEMSIPLGTFPGRAGNSLSNTFNYSSKVWQFREYNTYANPSGSMFVGVVPFYARNSAAGWTSTLAPPRILRPDEIPYYLELGAGEYDGAIWSNIDYGKNHSSIRYMKRLHVAMGDGSTHEFRATDTPIVCGSTGGPLCNNVDLTGIYLSVDGSRMRLEVTATTATLFMSDGSRVLFESFVSGDVLGKVAAEIIDEHGNKTAYNKTTKQWTDTIGRTLSDQLPPNLDSAGHLNHNQQQAVGTQVISMPGMGAVTLTWRDLKHPTSSDPEDSGLGNINQDLAYPADFYCDGSLSWTFTGTKLFFNNNAMNVRLCNYFGGGLPGTPFNPVVLTKITFANGQSYRFQYNLYGEIEKVIYPSGGYERFIYAPVTSLQAPTGPYEQTNRGVTDRYLSVNGNGSDEVHWTYSASRTYNNPPPGGPTDPYKVTVTNPDGSKTEQFLHDEPYYDLQRPFGFDIARTGRSFEDRVYAPGNMLLRRNLTEYTQTGPLPGGWFGATRDMRPTRQISIIFESGSSNALATMTETTFDSHADPLYFASLNPTQVKTYHYVAVNASTAQTASLSTAIGWFSGQTPARTVVTSYIYSENYKNRNITGLVSQTSVYGPAGEVARTQTTFDEQGEYAMLTDVTASYWQNPGTIYRGFPTTVRTWTDIGSGQYVDTHSQYDWLGNLRKSKDGRGFVTETGYSSAYHYSYATSTTSPIPDPSGEHGSDTPLITLTDYDFNTGLITSTTDPNNATMSMSYDSMLRPTFSQAPNGQQTTTEYGTGTDESSRWVRQRSQINGSYWKEIWTWYDGLGRTVRTESVDAENGNVFVETTYDNMGRVASVTNPYRNSDPIYLTSTGYDSLGRVESVSLPGGSFVSTTYSLATSGSALGTAETTTDEASRSRRTIEDALGNLIRVDEPNLSGTLGTEASPTQPTNYAWDAKGNLTQIIQGGQTRTFGYDAVNRLTSAVNPESGGFAFVYDANGNLTTKTDARGISTTFSYDRLNRVKLKDHSDTTPDVTYYYDNPQVLNSRGRLTRVFSLISETNYTAYDPDGRVTGSYQMTGGVFAPFGYEYNLAGDLISQTYPSGQIVSTSYDQTGDLMEVSRSMGGGTYKYASEFEFTAAGEIGKIKLGNGLWERTEYNSRRQIKKIILGFTEFDADVWQGEFEYGTLQGGYVNPQLNNGSIARQTITVPSIGAVPGFTAIQDYEYDPLDRLKSSTETVNGILTWKQGFNYDRFGNKTFDVANTTTLGSCPWSVCNPSADMTNNKLVGYGYDTAGNIITDAEGRTFTYDAENRQVTASGSGLTASYEYDGNGKRVKSYNVLTDQTTIFVYDATGKLAAEYTVNVPPPAAPTISYLTEDALGSPRVVTNSLGEVKARRDFFPFGDEIYAGYGSRNTDQKYSSSADDIRKKFATYQRDVETGLDWAQSRYYQPKHGRFTSPDEFKGGPDELFDFEEDASVNPTFYADLSYPQSLNKYQYGYNNPYKFNDPDGHCPGVFRYICHPAVQQRLIPASQTATKAGTAVVEKIGVFVGIVGSGVGGGTVSDPSCPACSSSQRMGQALLNENAQRQTNSGTGQWQGNRDSANQTPKATTPYKRPNNATTKEQRNSVQGKPCSDCGKVTPKQYANHKKPLVKEYYETGTIDKKKMRDVKSVNAHCKTCSSKEGGRMSGFSKEMKKKIEKD